MYLKLFWLISSLYVLDATAADTLRTRRDVAKIQNFARWMFGLSERNILQPYPLIENFENDRNYIIPDAQTKLLIAPTQSNGESVISRPLEYYRYGRPIFLYANRLPTYIEPVPSLYPINSKPGAIVTVTRQPLPHPPLYVQNSIRQVTLNRPIPSVVTNEDKNVMYSPNLPELEVFKPSLPSSSLPEQNIMKFEESPSTDDTNEDQIKPIPDLTLSLANMDSESNVNTNSNLSVDTQKKIIFKRPVHSRYSYKMIYHNQPHKNTVVKMENDITEAAGMRKEKPTSVPLPPALNANIGRMNPSMPWTDLKNRRPNDYLYIPPEEAFADTGDHKIRRKALKPANDFMSRQDQTREDNSAAPSETSFEIKPLTATDTLIPFRNADDENISTNPKFMANHDCKVKSLPPENRRGDIPELSLHCL